MSVDLKQFGNEVDDLLDGLAVGPQARIVRSLMQLAAKGGALRTDSKPLGDGLFELTPSYDGMEYRLIYAFHGRDAVILNCFVKKKRKTPKPEMELARQRQKLLKAGLAQIGSVEIH